MPCTTPDTTSSRWAPTRPGSAAAAAEAGSGVTPLVCDLANLADVRALHATIAAAAGNVDGVIHLVGGWRGAKGITDQSDEDWDFLERSAITTLRNVTRVFYDDLAASDTGRFAIVSSTAVSSPTAGGASYVAAKAAAEAWTLAVADGFRRDQESGSAERSTAPPPSLWSRRLLTPRCGQSPPDRKFPGFTDVEDLAAAAVGLFSTPAAELNGQRLLP